MAATKPAKDMKPIEILLIEDNPGDARLTAEALRDSRLANVLHHVRDGVEAIDFLRRRGRFAAAPRPDTSPAWTAGRCSRR